MSYNNIKNNLLNTGSGAIISNGIRIWSKETNQMIYLKNRYNLCFPAYNIPYASVLVNGKSHVRKEIFMLRVENPSQQNIDGIYEKDIVQYEYNGQIDKGIVVYNESKKVWTIVNDNKTVAFCKARNIIVIGNIYEN